MTGQIDLFTYMQEARKDIDFIYYLAEHLKEHCERWGYDWLEKLQKNCNVDNFLKLFCDITKTYYVHITEHLYYGAEFDKKNKIVRFYKCGEGFTGKTIQEYEIEELIKELKRSE